MVDPESLVSGQKLIVLTHDFPGNGLINIYNVGKIVTFIGINTSEKVNNVMVSGYRYSPIDGTTHNYEKRYWHFPSHALGYADGHEYRENNGHKHVSISRSVG